MESAHDPSPCGDDLAVRAAVVESANVLSPCGEESGVLYFGSDTSLISRNKRFLYVNPPPHRKAAAKSNVS